MQEVEPVMVVDLFPQERRLLLELFAELTEEAWQRSTVCPGWTVRDIGLHLLGDDIWRLFTKGIDREQARVSMSIEGDRGLGEKVLETVSIIA